MSQVIYRSQIKKYQNAPGPLPENETEEQKKKRLEEEAKKKATAQQTATATPATAATAQPVTATPATATAEPTAQAATTTQPATVTKPVGYLEINGIRATGDNATKQLNSIYAGSNDRFAQSIIGGLIASGGGAVVRGNKIILYDGSGKDVTSQYIQPGKTYKKTGFGRSLSATFNTSRDSNLRSLNQLISGNISADPTEEPPKPELLDAPYRGSGWFTTRKDANGKDIYDINAIGNKNIYDSIRKAYNIFGEEGYNKKYKTDTWTNDLPHIQALRNEIEEAGGIDKYLEGIKQAAIIGNLSQDQIKFLKYFGYSKDGNSTTATGSGDSSNSNDYWIPDNLKDHKDALKRGGIKFTKGEDGSYTVSGDIFAGDNQWALAGLDPFAGTEYENGFMYNGKLYTRDQVIADSGLGNIFRDYLTASANGANWNTQYNNMNASKTRFVGDRKWAGKDENYYGGYRMYDPTQFYAGDYDEYLRNNGFAGRGIEDLSGKYNLGEGQRLLAYTNGQDEYGSPKLGYLLFDKDGKVTNLDNLDAYASMRRPTALQVAGTADWGKIDNNGYAPVQEFVTQEAGKAKQTNALMYNPATDRYSLITNYNPETQGAKGIDIDPSRIEQIKAGIKAAIEKNRPWAVSNDYLSNVSKKSTTTPGTVWNKLEILQAIDPEKYTEVENAAKAKAILGPPSARMYEDAMREKNVSLKQGGKIDWNKLQKLQSGGAFAGPRQKEVTRETKDLQHDISKAHTFDEGFTESEKLRIAAAATDLGSMVASLFPGAQIAGAVGGVTGTTIQLAADRMAQKEGRNVGHYGWRAIGNYAMDAVSAIPIAGGAAKIFKVGKNIQKIAPILAKAMRFAAPALGAAGLANAQAALGKIVNGKWSELTSNDFVDLLNGISAATGGGAVMRQNIKDARTLTNLGDTAQATAKDAKAIKEGKVGDVIFDKKTGEVLEALDGAKTKAEALDKIKGFVKEKNASLDGEALDNAAQSVFDALGLKEKAGKKHIKRDGWKFSREAGDARFEMGNLKLPQSTSMWNEIFNPKRIWMRDENLAKAMSGLSAKEINAANKAVKTRTYNPNSDIETMGLFEWLRAKDTAQAISRMTVNNPQVFTNATFQVGKKISPVHGIRGAFGTRQYRTAFEPTPVTVTPTPTPTAAPVTPAPVTPSTAPTPVTTPTTTPVPAPTTPKPTSEPFNLEALITKFNRAMYGKYSPDTIQQALNIEEYVANNKQLRNYILNNPRDGRDMIRKIVGTWMPTGSKGYKDTLKALNEVTDIGKELQKIGVKFKQGGELPKFQDGGGFDIPRNGKKAKFNIPAMMDLTSAIAQSAAIGKAYDKQREAIRLAGLATKTSPRIYGTRFDISPIDRQVEEAIDPYKQVQFNSSDNRENMAGELQRAKAISNIRERGGEQKTEAINKFNTAEAQRLSAQASQNAQVADANRAQAINAASTIAQSEAAEKNEKYAQVWNTFSQQFRQQARDAANKKAEAQYAFDAKQAENEYNEAIKNEFASLRSEYEKDADKGNVTFETWIGSDIGRLNRYNAIKAGPGVIKAMNNYRTKLLGLQNKLYSDSNNFISFHKSGGKVEKKTSIKQSLTVNDRLTLQGDKAAKRAILQASNNLHKMLLKLMK